MVHWTVAVIAAIMGGVVAVIMLALVSCASTYSNEQPIKNPPEEKDAK